MYLVWIEVLTEVGEFILVEISSAGASHELVFMGKYLILGESESAGGC